MTESWDGGGAWVEQASRLRHDLLRIDASDERAARGAIANFMSEYGSDVDSMAAVMFDDLLELGYVMALRHVRDGKFDSELEEWGRPDV